MARDGHKTSTLAAIALAALWSTMAHGAPMAAATCHEKWSISIAGFDVGSATEEFDLDAKGSFHARSDLAPSGLAKMLGAPKIQREAWGDLTRGLTKRTESKESNGKREQSTWQRLPHGGFERVDRDGSTQIKAAEGYAVDTLLLIRLAMLMEKTEDGISLRVFSMGQHPTAARFSSKTSAGYEISSESLNATVQTNDSGQPNALSLSDGKQKAQLKLISGGCSAR